MAGAPKGNNNAVKGRMLSKKLRERLEERQKINELADVLIDKALEGDMAAIKEVFDRLDGKPLQAISGEDGAPIQIIIQGKDAKV